MLISYVFILHISTLCVVLLQVLINSRSCQNTFELFYPFHSFSVPRETKKQDYPMKFRSVLSPRKNAQNAPTAPETIIIPITKIPVENRIELANIVFLQGKPTFALAKFHKDKYLQTSSTYLPVYLLWLLKIEILLRMRLPTFSVFISSPQKDLGLFQ